MLALLPVDGLPSIASTNNALTQPKSQLEAPPSTVGGEFSTPCIGGRPILF
jgi:hypothetical protein